jgi:hypothetical protein
LFQLDSAKTTEGIVVSKITGIIKNKNKLIVFIANP